MGFVDRDDSITPQRIVGMVFRVGHSKSFTLVSDSQPKLSSTIIKKTVTIIGSWKRYFKREGQRGLYDCSPLSEHRSLEKRIRRRSIRFNSEVAFDESDLTVSTSVSRTSSNEDSMLYSSNDDSVFCYNTEKKPGTRKPRRKFGRKIFKRKKEEPQQPCAEFFKVFKPNDLIGY